MLNWARSFEGVVRKAAELHPETLTEDWSDGGIPCRKCLVYQALNLFIEDKPRGCVGAVARSLADRGRNEESMHVAEAGNIGCSAARRRMWPVLERILAGRQGRRLET